MMLTTHQNAVTARVLDEEESGRRHIVVSLSGAHAYGFPSPDSDLDLKAIHLAPTEQLLGLSQPKLHATRLETIDGVEIDYSSNEIGPVLAGILSGNGNYIERVIGALTIRTSPEHDELKSLVTRALSRKVFRHYQGFATGQLGDFEKAEAPTAKKVLYVLRTALTGTHLLRTGVLVTDLTQLWDEYNYQSAAALVKVKQTGERVVLDADTRKHWLGQIGRAFELLDHAHSTSPLPEESNNRIEVEDWLLRTRRRFL